MAETRKKLTEVQLKYLSETQESLTKARAVFAEAEKEAQRTLTLIFDAVGLPANAAVRFDEEAKELVHLEPDISPAALSPETTAFAAV